MWRRRGRASRAAGTVRNGAINAGPDLTHAPCGADGWGHQTAVIDCHDREVTGYEFALRGRSKEAERALEAACMARFGTLRAAIPLLSWIEWYNAARPQQAPRLSQPAAIPRATTPTCGSVSGKHYSRSNCNDRLTAETMSQHRTPIMERKPKLPFSILKTCAAGSANFSQNRGIARQH